VVTNWYGVNVPTQGTITNTSITTLVGVNIAAMTGGATNNYGIKIAAPTGGATINRAIDVAAGLMTVDGVGNIGARNLSGNGEMHPQTGMGGTAFPDHLANLLFPLLGPGDEGVYLLQVLVQCDGWRGG